MLTHSCIGEGGERDGDSGECGGGDLDNSWKHDWHDQVLLNIA